MYIHIHALKLYRSFLFILLIITHKRITHTHTETHYWIEREWMLCASLDRQRKRSLPFFHSFILALCLSTIQCWSPLVFLLLYFILLFFTNESLSCIFWFVSSLARALIVRSPSHNLHTYLYTINWYAMTSLTTIKKRPICIFMCREASFCTNNK